MAITLQGSWTLRVKSRNAAYAQRFIVSGAASGDGIYDGIEGHSVFITGGAWSVQVQHRPTRGAWRDSLQRLGLPAVAHGVLQVDISSNDGGLDDDYDDLVLTGSLPVSAADQNVYRNVRTYAQAALFNPGRDDYLVIDPLHLAAACARHPELREVIEKLYPERMANAHKLMLDPTPLVIPTGLPTVAVGLLFESRPLMPGEVDAFTGESDAVAALQATVKRVPFQPTMARAGAARLTRGERDAIGRVRESALRLRGATDLVAGLRLRFQAYHHTQSEALDGPYTGTGLREDLGYVSTDECGNYLFRYARPKAATCAALGRPDLLVQLMDSPSRVSFETAPYDQLANLRRIDLCVPAALAQPERLHRPDAMGQLSSSLFEYVGHTALVVVGPATGRCYRFRQPGATQMVDRRDRATLKAVPNLRAQQAA